MIYSSEEELRVFWKALVTSAIPIVSWYVAAMEIISRSVGVDRTGDEDWPKSITFTWGPLLAQWRGK